MALLAWHVEVYYLVLVGVINVEGCLQEIKSEKIIYETYLDVELTALLILNNASQG